MARGWESKSVESQQEEAVRGRADKKNRPLSEEERWHWPGRGQRPI